MFAMTGWNGLEAELANHLNAHWFTRWEITLFAVVLALIGAAMLPSYDDEVDEE